MKKSLILTLGLAALFVVFAAGCKKADDTTAAPATGATAGAPAAPAATAGGATATTGG
ncbi:MAG TPA: hypothetical protein VGL56_16425 [Fimbriimonadaceae bacterium]